MEESTNSEGRIFYAEQNDTMEQATKNAQNTFGFFWRELYWEYRRIIPALNFAMVKIPFAEDMGGDEPVVEHMWINNVYFDGENVHGELINQPNELTNVKMGDAVTKKLNEISDWLFAVNQKTYGGFTIQAMRAQMNDEERQEHDEAWGLDFGDYNEILVVIDQKESPEDLEEHPMSKNMKDNMREFLQENPKEINYIDDDGFTLLHKEAIAGNKSMIEVLLAFDADKNVKSPTGKTAYDYAKEMNWKHIEKLLK